MQVKGPIHISKKKTILWLAITALLSTYCKPTFSQSTVTNQFWTDYNLAIKTSERFSVHTPVGYRTIAPHTWDRFYINPHVRYDWPRLILKNMNFKEQLLGGVGIYYTVNQQQSNQLEIRPFQGYSLSAPNWKYFVLKHYLRLEERFELNTDDWENTFGIRLRYSATATLRFQGDFWSRGKGFYLPASAEFFWNMKQTKQFNDKVRLNLGLGKSFANNWKLAFLVGYNYSRQNVGESFHTNDIIYRLRCYYTIKSHSDEN